MLFSRRKKDCNNWQKIQNYLVNSKQILKKQKFVVIILTKVLASINSRQILKRQKFAIIISTKVSSLIET